MTQAWAVGSPEIPGTIFLVDYHQEGIGDVLVELYDGRVDGGYTVVDSLIIHEVPEPTTLLLLGLGGLFLRKGR